MDRNWYPGRVLSFTKAQGATQVEYDDGDVEMLHLVMERYRPETGVIIVASDVTIANLSWQNCSKTCHKKCIAYIPTACRVPWALS